MATILHIDDDPMILKSISTFLTKQGHVVISAESGVEAESLYEEHRPDLMILDVAMPNRNGLEVFDAIKAQFTTVPVLFCTGYSESFDLDCEENMQRWNEGFADGLTDMIFKPFSFEELHDKLESLTPIIGSSYG